MKKKLIVGIIISFLVIIILGLTLFPGMIKTYVVKHSPELIGRQIQLDNLRVNYLTSKVTVTTFKLFEANGQEVFISFDTLLVDFKPFRLFFDEIVVNRFYLSGLSTWIIQRDSTFNFDDLILFFNSDEDTATTDTAASDPMKFYLSNIEFRNSRLDFENQDLRDTLSLKDISFYIPYIGWDQSEKSKAGLRFSFREEGYFESSMQVDPIGGDFQSDITISRLQLDGFRQYLTQYANIRIFHGFLNCNLQINGNIHTIEEAIVSGHATIDDFRMSDSTDREFMAADKIYCSLKFIDYYNSSYLIDTLTLQKPYVYIELDSTTNNLYEIFYLNYEEESDSLNGDVTDTSSLYYAIHHLEITNGIVDYRDNLTGNPFDYHLSEVEIITDSILSTSPWVTAYSTMLLNDRGKLVAEVGFDPANPYDIILDYTITDFLLSDLNIYSRHYVGFPILYGDMYYKSHTEIINNQLTSVNKLIIQNVELGNKSGGIFDLPLKFALFLLKDRHGIINLDIPLRGDLNDPTVNVGKIIWNTLKNLIVKVATAPYDLLARMISVDPKDIKSIEYAYLDTTFTAEKQHQLDLLLELEQKKPDLKIELIYINDQDFEKKQIAVNEAGKLFALATGKDYRKDDQDFRAFLASDASLDSLDIVELSRVIIPTEQIDSLAAAYDLTRKSSLEKYLRQSSDSTGITVTGFNKQSPKNPGSYPMFEVKYSMSSEWLSR